MRGALAVCPLTAGFSVRTAVFEPGEHQCGSATRSRCLGGEAAVPSGGRAPLSGRDAGARFCCGGLQTQGPGRPAAPQRGPSRAAPRHSGGLRHRFASRWRPPCRVRSSSLFWAGALLPQEMPEKKPRKPPRTTQLVPPHGASSLLAAYHGPAPSRGRTRPRFLARLPKIRNDKPCLFVRNAVGKPVLCRGFAAQRGSPCRLRL
jgi:hypothetical protein